MNWALKKWGRQNMVPSWTPRFTPHAYEQGLKNTNLPIEMAYLIKPGSQKKPKGNPPFADKIL